MRIKRFTGPSVKEVLKAVKAEFGEGALILSTRRLNQSAHEVVAAIDYDLSKPVSLMIPEAAYGMRAPKGPAQQAARSYGNKGGSGNGGTGDGLKPAPAPAPSQDGVEALKKELKELRDLKEVFLKMMTETAANASPVYSRLEDELIKNGVDKRLTRKILMSVFRGAEGQKAGDEGYMKTYMKKKMLDNITVADPLSEKSVVAFVGPAGVGKTTTIAKLAAVNALKKKKRVALLTMDTYRIAAAEQLKVYGRIIGVPVEVAKSPNELASCIGIHRDKDLILIDTAGRSRRNTEYVEELRGIANISPSLRFNLVLSAESRDEALYDSVKGFSSMPVDSLTFTKLDCSRVYGPILNAMMLAGKPVAYLAAGQSVPEDIETATKERLVDFFMPN